MSRSARQGLLLDGNQKEHPEHRDMRSEYRVLFVAAILLGIALVFGLVFGLRPVDQSARIAELETITTHLSTELMGLMATSLTFTTRYIQNGTCKVGFPLKSGSAVQVIANFSDWVEVNYTLREIYFSASVPTTTFTIGATPRPIVFTGYTPPPGAPRENDLQVQIALCDPPIATLDALVQNFDLLAYSYIVASRVEIVPNCVAASLAEHDSSHCTDENGYSPFYSSSFPTPNSFQVFPNNLETPGSANLQFTWGHWDYSSFLNQYDFTGTNIYFSGPLEMLLPSL